MKVWFIVIGLLYGVPFCAGLFLGWIRFFTTWRVSRFGAQEFFVAAGWAVALLAYQHFHWQIPLRHWFGMFIGHVLPGWLAASIGCWLFYRVAQMCRRRPHA